MKFHLLLLIVSHTVNCQFDRTDTAPVMFCGDRCENQNDITSCLTCRAGFQAPRCCECEEGYLPGLDADRNRVCCRNSIIEETHNNYFFPYNESNGDERLLPNADDFSYGPRKLEVPVNIFNTLEYDLYVSTNGLISFWNPFSSFRSMSFSESFTDFNDPIIAPFWTDLIPEASVGSIYYRTTNDKLILDRIVNITTGFNQNFSNYQPSLAIIVTWEDVSPFSERSIQMSFQVVLSTDGKTSFATFLYGNVIRNFLACDLLTVLNGLTIGFNAGDRERFLNIPRSDLEEINVFRIDGNCITSDEVQCPLNSVTIQCMPQLACICDEGTQSSFCIDFFPYGIRSGDTIGPHAVDKSVGIMLNVSVVFFQRKETNIYISTNGVISFRSKFDSFNPVPFPSSLEPLIAPLWADFDFRELGSIYYRVTQDPRILTKFSNIVSEKNPNINYHPTLCVIMTWDSATFHSNGFRIALTFQVVLATDGEVSFAAFLYDKPNILMNVTSSVNALVGFDAGDQSRSSTIISNRQRNYLLESTNIFRIDGNCITGVSPGAVCGLMSTSLTCHDNLSLSSCLCDLGTTNITENNCRLTEFFPFGIGNGDTVGPRAVDASSEVIHLDVPIIFYQKTETDLYVSTNGLVSFQDEFDSYIVTQLPRIAVPLLPLIAPFWADYSFRDAGTLYYRVTNDSATLSYVAQKIANASVIFRDYTPTSAVIVTWFQSKVFRIQSRLVDNLNFQVILSTDGNVSFAVMLYGGDLRLSTLQAFTWLIGGFDAGDGRRGSYSLSSLEGFLFNEEYLTNVYRIDGHCIVRADRNRCGLNSVPILCGDEFNSLSCLCNAGTRSSRNNICLEYLQFGPRAGDATIPSVEELTATSQSLTLSTPLVFYKNPLSTINIFECGVVSPESFNCDNLNRLLNAVPLIVPYPLRNNFNLEGRYLYYRKAEDNTTLDEVTTMITDFNPNLINFYPKLAVVITWILDEDMKNSVQIILCSDGIISFVILLYDYPGRVVLNETLPIGFYAGDLSRRLVISQRSEIQAKNIFRIDGNCITTASPSDVCGLNSFASRCDNSSATSCSCYSGYENEDEKNCRDIDECVADSPCSINAECTNTEGSFMCECNTGFDGDGYNCTDINECMDGSLCGNNALCENTEGLFMCVCLEGFDGDGFNCTDIDECEVGTSNCTQICRNKDGGFSCSCEGGYEIDSDNRTCKDTDECEGDNECTQVCINTDGGYDCTCKDGFFILSDNKTCQGNVRAPNNSTMIGVTVSIGVIIALLVLAIMLLLLFFLSMRRRNRNKKIEFNFVEEIRDNNVSRLQQMSVQSSFKHNIPRELIINSSNLDLGKTIGQGEFGIVYKSHLKRSHHDTISDIVAVKTLKGFVQKELVRDLLKECVKMYELDHPNVLRLIGVCLNGGPAPYIIMPFMENGSLLSHLKAERESIVLDPNCSNLDDINTIMKKLMDMCIQVAKGMEYLASKRIIHRDLAARNCMIDVNFVIKVADFGLAESIDPTKDYFRQDQNVIIKLPVKWLALESINDGVFSEKSDVWSFGVTCWEIFNGGKTPYPGISPVDLPHQLENGFRMDKPLNAACSDDVYSLMCDCWAINPELRPPFAELVIRLSSQLITIADYMDFSSAPDVEIKATQ